MELNYDTASQIDLMLNTIEDPCDTTEDGLKECCIRIIRQEIALNSMVMCPTCHRMIKGFRTKNAFLHYVRFCKTRRRAITCHKLDEYYIVTYQQMI